MDNNTIDFVDESKTQAKIKVIGVGGGGGNAVNAMLKTSLEGEVAMHAVNTDAQALGRIADGCGRVQIGKEVTKGLGVGGYWKKAEEAARHDINRIEDIVSGADMVFIAAGMGGGTGTGASPVIAEKCRELGILTVAVVTKPFDFENRGSDAQIGIDNLTKQVDSIIVVPNDRIQEVYGTEMSIEEGYGKSDEILTNAVAGICEIIYCPGKINVDFADVKAVMSEMGQAMMGTATETGVDRAARAAKSVIECPLLEGINLSNARGVLVNLTVNPNSFMMREIDEAMSVIRNTTSSTAKVFFGLVDRMDIGDELRITMVATGLRSEGIKVTDGGTTTPPPSIGRKGLFTSNRNRTKTVNSRDQGTLLGGDDSNLPAILRRQQS